MMEGDFKGTNLLSLSLRRMDGIKRTVPGSISSKVTNLSNSGCVVNPRSRETVADIIIQRLIQFNYSIDNLRLQGKFSHAG